MGTLKKISHLPKVEEMSCSCCCWGPVFTFRKMVRHLKQNVVVSKYISISILVTFIQYIVLYMPIFSGNIHMYFSFFLEVFLHWSPVAYWAPADGVPLSASCLFAFSYCSWGSQGKNVERVCHSLLQWTTFCQTSPPWPIHRGWPYTAWLIVSLS